LQNPLALVLVEHLYFFELTSPQHLLLLVVPKLKLERCVAMVPEALPYGTDPTPQIRFPETPPHLHQHAKLHVLGLHELPSLDEAKKVRWWRISERQAAVFFAILLGGGVVAPGVEGMVALAPVHFRCLFDG
jgi:hypothetical protein